MSASGLAQRPYLLSYEHMTLFSEDGYDAQGRFVHVGLQADSDDEDDCVPWRDQGDGLPDPTTISTVVLTPIPKLKVDGSNIQDWTDDVSRAMSAIQISQALQPDLLRPNQGTTNRGKWRRWSSFAAHWMTMMMNEDTRSDIKWGLADTEWARSADDLLCDINRWFKAKFPNLNRIVENDRLNTMQRSDFKSASEYLNEMQRKINKLSMFGRRPQPIELLDKVIDDLGSELDVIGEISEKLSSMEESELSAITFATFVALFNEIRENALLFPW